MISFLVVVLYDLPILNEEEILWYDMKCKIMKQVIV